MRKAYDFSKGKRGAVLAPTGKTRITIMLDNDVIEHFRSKAETQGTGYQTMINAALRAAMAADEHKSPDDRLVTAGVLRQVLREELAPYEAKAPRPSVRPRGRARPSQRPPASSDDSPCSK